MSYSFAVAADTKNEASQKINAEFDKIVAMQPIHAKDRREAEESADMLVDVLKEPDEGECIKVTMSGSLGWRSEDIITSASVNISAYIGPKA